MRDPSAPLSEAIFAKLAASSGVTAKLGSPLRIYDKVPDAVQYPYARTGEIQPTGASNACFDIWDTYVTFHVFSRDPQIPRLQVQEIFDAIAQAIGNDGDPPTVAGFSIDEISLEQSRSFYEDDGVTVHGVLTLQYAVTETA